MTFRARNAHYLRISAHTILPLYLYLDDRHIEWMTDYTFQCVISDLQPLIPLKLQADESGSKKGLVEVHKGAHYQFAYFFRKVEPHSLVIKSRYFVARPKPPSVQPQSPAKPTGRKRKRSSTTIPSKPKKGKQANQKDKTAPAAPKKNGRSKKGKEKATEDSEEEAELSGEGDEMENNEDKNIDISATPSSLRRSNRRKKPVRGYQEALSDEDIELVEDQEPISARLPVDQDGDLEMSNSEDVQQEPSAYQEDWQKETTPMTIKAEVAEHHLSHLGDETDIEVVETDLSTLEGQGSPETAPPTPSLIALEIEEAEEKPKPMLQLRYKGFSIHDICLCVVIEPWPPLTTDVRATPAPQREKRKIAPKNYVSSEDSSNKSLPPSALRSRTPLFLPDYDRDRSMTPAPFHSESRFSSVAPSVTGDETEDESGDNGGLMAFSQVLNSLGGDRAADFDEDDDMDGDVLFGDADERRAL